MKISHLRGSAIALAIGLSSVLSSGCDVTGGGYGYDDGGYGVGYYQPAGVVYGGWGSGYEVAPYRGGGGGYRAGRGGGQPAAAHAYRPAPASHAAPSIPSRSGSGGRGTSKR